MLVISQKFAMKFAEMAEVLLQAGHQFWCPNSSVEALKP